jgi:hypothetical protein
LRYRTVTRRSPEAGRSAVRWTRQERQTGDSKRPPGSFGRVAFETNCRSVPVPFVLLSKRTERSLVPDAGTSPSKLVLREFLSVPTVRMGLPRADPVGTLKGICTLNQRAPQIWKELPLRSVIPIIAALVTVVTANVSLAQSTATPPPESGATCPPDVKGEPPTVGGGSSEPLSDKLAQSKGVICPPAGVDREMEVTPPSGGHLKVIPPPGTPGGDPNVQPK